MNRVIGTIDATFEKKMENFLLNKKSQTYAPIY